MGEREEEIMSSCWILGCCVGFWGALEKGVVPSVVDFIKQRQRSSQRIFTSLSVYLVHGAINRCPGGGLAAEKAEWTLPSFL